MDAYKLCADSPSFWRGSLPTRTEEQSAETQSDASVLYKAPPACFRAMNRLPSLQGVPTRLPSVIARAEGVIENHPHFEGVNLYRFGQNSNFAGGILAFIRKKLGIIRCLYKS